MCVNLRKLPNGVLVPCRKCWQCRENKVNDWVGRCIAESETARASMSVTLTYGGGDHERAAVLTYSDVQKYIKLLRRHGYPCRYFAVGEYGSAKGRAHWHVVLFFTGDVPPHEDGQRFIEPHWSHGYSFWEAASPANIRYVCKYIQKDIGKAERQGHLAMSRKPPLGAEYFRQRARRYVDQGLAPQDAYYSFPEVRDENGKPVQFYLSGVSLDRFVGEYLDEWQRRYPGVHEPTSDLVLAYLDRWATYAPEVRIERRKLGGSYPWIATPGNAPVLFSEPHNAFYYVAADGLRRWWSYDQYGDRAWQKNLRVSGVTTTRALEAGSMWRVSTRDASRTR